ncbi:MAG: hypothetical protein L6V81_06115 [Clostridium sp.]|nr:MAG: hypothetical protein L6V81_06115 [Clostridium sp.]
MKKSNKNVSSRNYFIVMVVSVLIIVVVLYARTFYLNYKKIIKLMLVYLMTKRLIK